MKSINTYPSIFAIGHRSIQDIFTSDVVIEEKIDGSQISMGIIDGELCMRSKGKDLIIDAPEKMFTWAIESAKGLPLHPGWIYRGEYLQKPKHNTLAYGRTPKQHIIIFDIQFGIECYLSPAEKAAEAARLGLECVPVVYQGKVTSMEQFTGFLERESVLGGCKVEGVVVKNYAIFTHEKKVAIGKYVSEAFKEVHRGEWKKSNPAPKDVVQVLIGNMKTEARWNKSIQHLRDNGDLTDTPQDIGKLIKAVQTDVRQEEESSVKDMLFDHFWPQIQRGIIGGLPEFYKKQLAERVIVNSGADVISA